MTYNNAPHTDLDYIKARGMEAEQFVKGITRGGYILSGRFYFHDGYGFQHVAAGDYKLV